MTEFDDIFGGTEPPRDAALGAALRSVVGHPPVDQVDWTALAARIATARARQAQSWWSYAAGWERGALPVALAAGIAGLFALWRLGMPPAVRVEWTPDDAMTAVVEGTPADEAARSFARSVTAAHTASQELY